LERPELAEWEGPAVVKPAAAGSSYGVSVALDALALRAAVREAFLWDSRVLVEECIHGREVDMAVWPDGRGGHEAGPALEIVGDGIFDTRTKYDGSARFDVPADVSPSQADELARAALVVFTALGCKGIARVDFFLEGDVVVFNEINTTPGLTTHSQVPRMYCAAGDEYAELVERALLAAVPGLRGDVRAIAPA
jgi:D-alanine-D-alanine ligase